MTRIRTKDKIFLAVAVPLAVCAAYLHFWRMPVAKKVAALAAEERRLPCADDFPHERRALESRVAEAERELERVRAEKAPEGAVKGYADAGVAERQGCALAAFAKHGARVLRVEPMAESADGWGARGGDVLRATALRPVPEAMRFTVEAPYPDFAAALGEFAAARSPVVPEAVNMVRAGTGTKCRWEVALWL
jgi:hypothetical protein